MQFFLSTHDSQGRIHLVLKANIISYIYIYAIAFLFCSALIVAITTDHIVLVQFITFYVESLRFSMFIFILSGYAYTHIANEHSIKMGRISIVQFSRFNFDYMYVCMHVWVCAQNKRTEKKKTSHASVIKCENGTSGILLVSSLTTQLHNPMLQACFEMARKTHRMYEYVLCAVYAGWNIFWGNYFEHTWFFFLLLHSSFEYASLFSNHVCQPFNECTWKM